MNPRVVLFLFFFFCQNLAIAQVVLTGDSLSISGSSANTSGQTSQLAQEYISTNGGGDPVKDTYSLSQSATSMDLSATQTTNAVLSGSSQLLMTTDSASLKSTGSVYVSSSPITDPSTGQVSPLSDSSFLGLTATTASLQANSTDPSSYAEVTWGGINGLKATASGTEIGGTGTVSITGSSITVTGDTNINTTGNANTVIGNSTGTGTVKLQSGGNSILMNNSGITLTGNTSITGGELNMNGNKITNVANAQSNSDAVNYGQMMSSISTSNQHIESEIASINRSMSQMQSEYKAGIAGVAAMNSIPGLHTNQKVNIGVGVGSFGGNTGIAAGTSVRLNSRAIIKASVANSGGQTTGGAGISIGF